MLLYEIFISYSLQTEKVGDLTVIIEVMYTRLLATSLLDSLNYIVERRAVCVFFVDFITLL